MIITNGAESNHTEEVGPPAEGTTGNIVVVVMVVEEPHTASAGTRGLKPLLPPCFQVPVTRSSPTENRPPRPHVPTPPPPLRDGFMRTSSPHGALRGRKEICFIEILRLQ
jgi:hypothetical protein